MAQHNNHLCRAYDLQDRDATIEFYDDWADTYDAELIENGYVTPDRCAAALAKHAQSFDIAVLDIGCGTGISGKALRQAGFTNLTGADVSDNMLKKAINDGVYGDSWLMDPNDPFPFANGTYDAITAIGVIGNGAAPVEVLDQATAKLSPGGLFVVSLNDHALAVAEFPAAVDACVDSGGFELLLSEYGPHIVGKKLNCRIYVLRKT